LGGAVTTVAVSWSIVANKMSALRPTVTLPAIGKTQAKEDGEPEKLISS
jgi:hypothetical protein